MKKFFKSVTDTCNRATMNTAVKVECLLANNRGEGYLESGIKLLVAVVIGALLLAGLYKLFDKTIMPTVTKKVTDLFNYKG